MIAYQLAGLAAALQETRGGGWGMKRIGQGTSPAACRRRLRLCKVNAIVTSGAARNRDR
jgi:hypothetical protein